MPLGQKLLDFGGLKGASGGGFAEREAATILKPTLAGAGVTAVVFLDDAAAVGARRLQGRIVTGNRVAVVFLGLFDHALGHRGNLGHEGLTAHLAVLHLGQLVFPFAGEFSLGELFDAQSTQQGHQLKRLGGRNQLPTFAQHVFFGDQALNDAGAGGRGAQAFFLHRFAQLVVFHGLARAFHGTQQGGLRVTCRGLGLQTLRIHRIAQDLFIW